ncbi:hypothetical protein GCM10008171_17200 [Methylopila jiangsuensis]|uniref:Uncharacterized protein n=1 Tax=Methylopila jiangsuensis TaxID=586230 RepID=A0A9W6N3P8_9HYPH|nr:hypothetical protein GCM10008171_17200 [Methylopila jiangsuensis]
MNASAKIKLENIVGYYSMVFITASAIMAASVIVIVIASSVYNFCYECLYSTSIIKHAFLAWLFTSVGAFFSILIMDLTQHARGLDFDKFSSCTKEMKLKDWFNLKRFYTIKNAVRRQ